MTNLFSLLVADGNKLKNWYTMIGTSTFYLLHNRSLEKSTKNFIPILKRREKHFSLLGKVFHYNYLGEIQDFLERIKAKRILLISLENSLKTMAVCFAGEESVEKGKTIETTTLIDRA